MLVLAKFKHFDNKDFECYRVELEEYYKYRCNQKLNWQRHWEYPWVLKNGQFEKTDIVADAGGGYNYFPCVLSKYVKEVVVIDHNAKSLNHCVSFTPRFICQDLAKLNLDEKFDKVISISVIEHINNWRNAIKNLTKILKTNGLLIMTIGLDLDNKRPLFYSDNPEILSILKEYSMELIGEQDIKIEDEFTKEKILQKGLDFPELNAVNIEEERYTTIGIIARKYEKTN